MFVCRQVWRCLTHRFSTLYTAGKKRARSAEPAAVRERGKQQAKSLFSIIRLQFNESTADEGLTQHEIVVRFEGVEFTQMDTF